MLRDALDGAIEVLNEICLRFTSGVWEKIIAMSYITEIRNKFLYCLFGEELRRGVSFKDIKQRMEQFAPRDLSTRQVSELLPICKNYKSLSKNFAGEFSQVKMLLKWIKKSVEHKLKEQLYINENEKHKRIVKEKQLIYQQFIKESGKVNKLKRDVANYRTDLDYYFILPVNLLHITHRTATSSYFKKR